MPAAGPPWLLQVLIQCHASQNLCILVSARVQQEEQGRPGLFLGVLFIIWQCYNRKIFTLQHNRVACRQTCSHTGSNKPARHCWLLLFSPTRLWYCTNTTPTLGACFQEKPCQHPALPAGLCQARTRPCSLCTRSAAAGWLCSLATRACRLGPRAPRSLTRFPFLSAALFLLKQV